MPETPEIPETPDDLDPTRIDDAVRADDVPGTADGAATSGVEIDEEQVADAVEPDDNAFEVDGPQASAGHA